MNLSESTTFSLAEAIHNLLEISLAPSVPASLPNISTKYNIIIRLWTRGFDKLLESLRSASFTSVLALEYPQDFIPYAYTFYTGLLEEQTLGMFRAGWLDALGDLARYHMSIEAMVRRHEGLGPEAHNGSGFCRPVCRPLPLPVICRTCPHKSSPTSEKLVARIDDSPRPSVGLAAAKR